VSRLSCLKNVSGRFQIDLDQVDDYRITMSGEFNGVYIDGVNLKLESPTERKENIKIYEEAIRLFPNADSLKLVKIPLDNCLDMSLNQFINLKKLDISGIKWRNNYSRAPWNMLNLEVLNITSTNHFTISSVI
jgi:hypothetical protein